MPRRLLRRRADRRLRAGFDPARIGFHGNNKTAGRAARARSTSASAGSSSTPSTRSSGWRPITAELGRTSRVMVRVTAGVEAHTHEYIATAHEDQKFGFSITSGDAFEAVRRIEAAPGPRAARPALPHRLPDLRLLRVRGRGPPGAGAAGPDLRRARRGPARDGPRRRLRHRLHHPGRPVRPRAAGHRDDQDRRARVPRPRHPRAAAVDRARPRDRRPGDVHRLQGRHGQGRSSSTAAPCAPTSPSTAG